MRWQCVIFDLDGTLVDSEILNLRAYAELIPEITDTVDVLVERYGGVRLDRVVQDIEQRYGVKLSADFETVFRRHVRDLYEAELKPIEGIPELLADLTIPCCVASNAPRQKIEHALAVTQLSDYFNDQLFSAYEVGVWKPAPDLFLHASEQMGADPVKCAVVEDSETGVAAGLAAGMEVFHYGYSEQDTNSGYRSIMHMSELAEYLHHAS